MGTTIATFGESGNVADDDYPTPPLCRGVQLVKRPIGESVPGVDENNRRRFRDRDRVCCGNQMLLAKSDIKEPHMLVDLSLCDRRIVGNVCR